MLEIGHPSDPHDIWYFFKIELIILYESTNTEFMGSNAVSLFKSCDSSSGCVAS